MSLVTGQTMKINGAWATFPNPICQKWFSEYNKLHTNVEINYQSICSLLARLATRRLERMHARA